MDEKQTREKGDKGTRRRGKWGQKFMSSSVQGFIDETPELMNPWTHASCSIPSVIG
jgi:hypothetical protein